MPIAAVASITNKDYSGTEVDVIKLYLEEI